MRAGGVQNVVMVFASTYLAGRYYTIGRRRSIIIIRNIPSYPILWYYLLIKIHIDIPNIILMDGVADC